MGQLHLTASCHGLMEQLDGTASWDNYMAQLMGHWDSLMGQLFFQISIHTISLADSTQLIHCIIDGVRRRANWELRLVVDKSGYNDENALYERLDSIDTKPPL